MSKAVFRIGAYDQDSGDKHLPMGDLVTATNIWMRKKGQITKRPGFQSQQVTYSGATLGIPVDMNCMKDGSACIRDNSDQLWTISGTTGTYITKHKRPWWETNTVMPAELTVCRPKAVQVGSNIWYFTVNNAASSYRLTIIEMSTGAVVQIPIVVSAAATVHNLAPIYDGTNVWVFYVSATDTIRAHKFVVATPTVAPTAYTYLSVVGTTWTCIDAKWMSGAASGAGRCYVVAGSGNGGGSIDRRIMYSYLNAGTGAATSPTYLHTSTTSLAICGSSVAILEGQDGSETNWYFGYCAFTSITEIRLCKVASAGWTNTTSQLVSTWPNGPHIASGMTTTTHVFASIVGGYCSSATTQTMYAQAWSLTAANASYLRNDELTVWRGTFTNGTWDGSGPTDPNIVAMARGSWLASTPFKVGSDWYFLTGFDDGHSPTTVYRHLQQSYHLRNTSDGSIIAQVSVGQGAAVHHIEASVTSGIVYTTVARPIVSGSKCFIPITISNTNVAYCSGGMTTIDFAKTYGKDIEAMDRVFSAGPIPIVWNGSVFHEVSPLLDPYYATFNTVSTADYGVFAIRYVFVDPDGTQWRGAPIILTQNITAGSIATIPTLRHIMTGSTARIEVYLGLAASPTPKFQTTIANDPTVHSVTYTIPATASFVSGETLDQGFGGALEQAWPMRAAFVAKWRNRIFLGHDNHLHYSKEMTEGFGPLFNDVLTVTWGDASGREMTGAGVVNWDYFAMFCSDRVGVISGPGPDGIGNGNYSAQTLSTEVGTSNMRTIQQGQDGCFFVDTTGAGRLCVVTPGLQVSDVEGTNDGLWQSTMTDCYWSEQVRCLVWIGDAYMTVLDYGNRTERFPRGRVYRWNVYGYNAPGDYSYPPPRVACSFGGAVYLLNDNGDKYTMGSDDAIWSDFYRGNEAPIVRTIKTGKLQPDDLFGEFDLRWLQVMVSRFTDASMIIKVFPEYSGTASETVTASITSSAQQFAIRPSACARIEAFAVQIEDTGTGGRAAIDGIAIDYHSRGRIKMLSSTQVL